MASRARQGRESSTESRVQAAGRLREPRTGHILAPRTTALQLRLHVVEVHAGAMTHVYRPYSIAIGVKSQSMCAMVLGYTRTVSRYSRVLIYCATGSGGHRLTSAGFAPATVCLRGVSDIGRDGDPHQSSQCGAVSEAA